MLGFRSGSGICLRIHVIPSRVSGFWVPDFITIIQPKEVLGDTSDMEDFFENIFEEKNEPIKEFLYKYAKENIAIVYIFIRDPYYTKIKKDEAISIVSFIGNIGGFVGLCLGLSFVSVFEIIFHCFNFIRIQK